MNDFSRRLGGRSGRGAATTVLAAGAVFTAWAVWASSAQAADSVRPLSKAFERPQTLASATSQPARTRSSEPLTGGPAIAEVNGETISRAEFDRVLIASYGMRVMRQMVLRTAARQLVRNSGLTVGDVEVQAELNRIVSAVGGERDREGRALTRGDRQQLLEVILAKRGISYDEFLIGVERQACLRAVAVKSVTVSDEQLKQEFGRKYGPRRDIRAIVVDRLTIAQQVFDNLKTGKEFSDMVAEFTLNVDGAANGGRILTVTRDDPRVPPVVLAVVMGLKENEYSAPIQAGTQYWLVRVDRILPAEPIQFNSVRDSLKTELKRKLTEAMMEKLQQQLLETSKIDIYHLPLAQDFDAWRELQTKSAE